jgi:hypothetical protein
MIDLDIKVPTGRFIAGRWRGMETGETCPVHDHATVDR